jgi:hypothetical protein
VAEPIAEHEAKDCFVSWSQAAEHGVDAPDNVGGITARWWPSGVLHQTGF